MPWNSFPSENEEFDEVKFRKERKRIDALVFEAKEMERIFDPSRYIRQRRDDKLFCVKYSEWQSLQKNMQHFAFIETT